MKCKNKRCAICYTWFSPNSNSQIYCSKECKGFATKKIDQEKKPKKKKVESLTKLQKEASKLGMSYGMYVAQMQMQKGVRS